MKNIAFVFICFALTVVVNAHFQIAFPPPRGPFVEDDEPTFCDGYTNVTTNRTQFPLSGGFVTLNSEHPSWSAAFFVATNPNPSSFDDFTQVNTFFGESGEGQFCIPLDFSKSNFTTLQNGQNATIQMLFSGGDGKLFQCADVILTNDQSSISSVKCLNQTSGAHGPRLTTAYLDLKLLGLLSVVSVVPLFM